MASEQLDLCQNAVILELKELNTIRLSHESLLTLESRLLDVYRMLCPKPDDYEQRARLVQTFNLWAKDAFDAHGDFPIVEAFGSFTMDLFTVGSDLDLSINFSDDYTTELPRDEKVSILRKLTKFLNNVKKEGNISKIFPVLSARVPVVKVVDFGTGIECDFSAENKDGVSRSSIFTIVSSIDERFRILSYLMKAWAKAHRINCSRFRTMNSLSIISLVAFHLQTRDPPILPPFSALLKDGTDVSSVQKVAVGFKDFGRRNEESVSKLFGTLLIKLSAVENLWSQGLCVSTFEGSWIQKEWKTKIKTTIAASLSIEDFLTRSENSARAVGKAQVKKIYRVIKRSLLILSRFLNGLIGETELKKGLFGDSLDPPKNHLSNEQTDLKIPTRSNEPGRWKKKNKKRKNNRVNLVTDNKKTKHAETFQPCPNIQTTSTTCTASVNPPAQIQVSRAIDGEKPILHLLAFEPCPNVQTTLATCSVPVNPPAQVRVSRATDEVKPIVHLLASEPRPNVQTTSTTSPVPVNPPAQINPIVRLQTSEPRSNVQTTSTTKKKAKKAAKHAKASEPCPNIQSTSTTRPVSQNPPAKFQASRATNHVNPIVHLQSSYRPQYQQYPPTLPVYNPIYPYAPFPPNHVELHPQRQSPFLPHLGNMPQYHSHRPFNPHPYFGFEPRPSHAYNLQRPLTPCEGHRPQFNSRDAGMPQFSYGSVHRPSPLGPGQFPYPWRRHY